MDSLLVILLLAALVFFWWDSIGVKERARNVSRQLCLRHGVQFLDDTVALVKISLRRNSDGQLCFYRIYKFEFSSNKNDRYAGKIFMLGRKCDKTEMDAYRIPE